MGILKNLTYEYFGDLTREESLIKTNLKNIDFVDIGCSVLWANIDLEIYNHPEKDIKFENKFSFDEVYDIKFKNGLRFPTVSEFKELESVNKTQQNTTLVFSNDGFDDKLYFFCEKVNNYIRCLYITSKDDGDFVCGVELDERDKIRVNKYYKKGNFLFRVRLVKDK